MEKEIIEKILHRQLALLAEESCRKSVELPELAAASNSMVNVVECLIALNGDYQKKEVGLSKFRTKDLVDELSHREGVEKKIIGPYEGIKVSVDGPAIALVVID